MKAAILLVAVIVSQSCVLSEGYGSDPTFEPDWSESTSADYGESTPVYPASEQPSQAPSEMPTTTTAAPVLKTNPYCQCDVDGFFSPQNWDWAEIWVDLVIILDTSEAMGDRLIDAATMIETFVGEFEGDALNTNQNSKFYTRVGLISMAKEAQVIYNLNMTVGDEVQGKVQVATGVTDINVVAAFQAAERMLNDGVTRKPERSKTRQVIYYMTDSDPDSNLSPLEQFKTSNGIIVVNNFHGEGDVIRPGLQKLASEGYYFTDLQENYMQTLHVLCKANCYCPGGRDTYGGPSPDVAVKAAGGCYHPVPTGVPYSKARQACSADGNGHIAAVHDDDKASYVNGLMKNVMTPGKSYFFWIGYSKLDTGNWQWDIPSTDPYTNWDTPNGEPSPAAIAKCAYVDSSQKNLPWGAGNCQIGFPYVCEYKPCSVGNNDCY